MSVGSSTAERGTCGKIIGLRRAGYLSLGGLISVAGTYSTLLRRPHNLVAWRLAVQYLAEEAPTVGEVVLSAKTVKLASGLPQHASS